MIGKTVSHYKIIEKLGEGGMGVVYKAQDTRLKRTVCLKFLAQELTRDDQLKERFAQEAIAASALEHNNICTVYEIDETKNGQGYIVMAYYKGETLRRKLERGEMPVRESIDIALQMSRGLVEAHEAGIVHRDIKPANIIITQKGEVKILDFGLAKLAGKTKKTKTGSTLGTVDYMSPEQAQGLAVDHRSDIWSVGVVLYEMLAGKKPFIGEQDLAVMYNIVNSMPESLAAVRADVSPALAALVDHMLEKDP